MPSNGAFVRIITRRLKLSIDLSTSMQAATNQEEKLIKALEAAARKYPSAVTVPESLSIVANSVATFQQSRDEYMCRVGELKWAMDEMLEGMEDSALRESLAYRLSGGSAVFRMVNVLKFSVLRQPLQDFTVDELVNFGGYVTPAQCREISTSGLLQTMQVCERECSIRP